MAAAGAPLAATRRLARGLEYTLGVTRTQVQTRPRHMATGPRLVQEPVEDDPESMEELS